MALQGDSKISLHGIDSGSSLLEDDVSTGFYDEASEGGVKCDTNTEDFLSAEDDERKSAVRIDSGVSVLNTFKSELSLSDQSSTSNDEFDFFKKSDIEILSSDGALESAALLAEGIKTLGKTQEENWRRMNDLVAKKDHLIQEMTKLVMSFKQRIESSEACCEENEKTKVNLCASCKTPFDTKPSPEGETNELWSQNPADFIEELYRRSRNNRKCDTDDNITTERPLQEDVAEENSCLYDTEVSEMPILDVPREFCDEHDAD